jgi:feruloyl esterase
MFATRIAAFALLWTVAAPFSYCADDSRCTNLKELKLDHAQVTSAAVSAAGSFLPPGLDPTKPEANAYKKLPAFCRVRIESTPASDSTIPIEVWLPLASWNQKFRGQGNGGFA